MRRRLRTILPPLHRHTLLQLAADGALATLAYFLAYRLRFDQGVVVPERYQRLLDATIIWVFVAAIVIFARLPAWSPWSTRSPSTRRTAWST